MGAADVVPVFFLGTIALFRRLLTFELVALSGVNKDSLGNVAKGDVKALWRHFDGLFYCIRCGYYQRVSFDRRSELQFLAVYPFILWSFFFFGLIWHPPYF